MNDIPIVRDVFQVKSFLYDKDIVDLALIGELGRRSVGKHSNTVRLKFYNRHLCYVFIINVLSEACRCPS